MKKFLIATSVIAASATAAQAHVGVGDVHGMVSGFMHPVGGADHVLAMVAVGVIAAMIGGRARWAVPLSFVVMMVLGGIAGMLGLQLPQVEAGIAFSVIVLGLVIALQWKTPLTLAAPLVGFFAVFHGLAHGAEMPVETSGIAFATGFVVATALLHIAGLGLGFLMLRLQQLAKVGGVAIAAAGVGLFTGWL